MFGQRYLLRKRNCDVARARSVPRSLPCQTITRNSYARSEWTPGKYQGVILHVQEPCSLPTRFAEVCILWLAYPTLAAPTVVVSILTVVATMALLHFLVCSEYLTQLTYTITSDV